jgi:hypothetical protein
MARTKKTKPQIKVVYLESGTSLSDVLERVKADGITDLSCVKYDHDYIGCCGGHSEGEYCYCPSSYADMRFEYEVKT